MISETWNLGSGEAVIDDDKYQGMSGIVTIYYKTGTSPANCEADTWHLYDGTSFTSTGWAKIRVVG